MLNWKKTVVLLAVAYFLAYALVGCEISPVEASDIEPFIVTDVYSMTSTGASENSGNMEAWSIPFSGPIKFIHAPIEESNLLGWLGTDNVYTDYGQSEGVIALGLLANVIIQAKQTVTLVTDIGTRDIYLPELIIGWMSGSVNAVFYVDVYGSTYHSRSDHNYNYDTNGGESFPNLTPEEAMVPHHVARWAPGVASVWSSDSGGNPKSTFLPDEEVYVIGSFFPISTDTYIHTMTIYIIPDGEYAAPSNAVAPPSTGRTDFEGHLLLTLVWSPPLTMGDYDIWVDANQNEGFDEGDVWKNFYVDVPAFNVVSEPAIVVSMLLMFGSLATFYLTRRR